MRLSVIRTLVLSVVFGLIPLSGFAQETGITPQLHPWGLFEPGAWKIVRVITETLNEKGIVVSTCTTDTKTTLVDINDDGVTLEIQSCMEVAGKRFEPEPQTIRQGFCGESLGPSLKQNPPTKGSITIEGKKIPCQILRLENIVPNGKTLTTLYYSTTVAPYVLKRVCVITDSEGKNTLAETNIEAIALNMPLKVQGENCNGIRMKTVHKNTSGTVTTWADVLTEVPGGVVNNHSKKLDQTGRLVRRSTLVLIDYSTEPERERMAPIGRRRSSRQRVKSAPRHAP